MQHTASEDIGELATATPSQGVEEKSGMVPLVVGVVALLIGAYFVGTRPVSDRAPIELVRGDESQQMVRRLKVAQKDDIVVTKYDMLYRTHTAGRENGIVVVSCSNTRRVTVDFSRSPLIGQIKTVVGPADADYAKLFGTCLEQRSPLRQ